MACSFQSRFHVAAIFALWTIALCISAGSWGCRKTPAGPPAKWQSRGQSERAKAIAGDRAFVARIILHGPIPPPLAIVGGQHAGHDVPADESIIVSPDGGVKNCVIFLKDAPVWETVDLPTATLMQVGLRFDPHVLALRTGQPLIVQSKDQTLHNIQMQTRANPPQNLVTRNEQTLDPIVFKSPEIAAITCDVHPWMRAQLAIFEHPWFAVSDGDGRFEISGLAPGKHTFVSRHERLGELEFTVDLNPAPVANQQLPVVVYESPAQ